MIANPPFHRALLFITFLCQFEAEPVAAEAYLCSKLNVKFPTGYDKEQALANAVLPERLALLKTTDKAAKTSPEIFNTIAQELGFELYCENFNLIIPNIMYTWRADSTARMFLETLVFCGIDDEQIKADFKTCYNIELNNQAFTAFKDLFVDVECATDKGWETYASCVGLETASFVAKLLNQPKDYVRWKLGVPVSLDSDMVLNRLLSDAYFTRRACKLDGGDSLTMPDDLMKRFSFESKMLLSTLDRRMKLREAEAASAGTGNSDVNDPLRSIIIDYTPHETRLVEELGPD